jgi:hypothetical protein
MTSSETYIGIRSLIDSGLSKEDAEFVFDEFVAFLAKKGLLKNNPRERGALAFDDLAPEGQAFYDFVIRPYQRKLYQTKYLQKSRLKWLEKQLAEFVNIGDSSPSKRAV